MRIRNSVLYTLLYSDMLYSSIRYTIYYTSIHILHVYTHTCYVCSQNHQHFNFCACLKTRTTLERVDTCKC